MSQHTNGRKVIANINISIDGRYAAPENPIDMSWVIPYATTDVGRDHMTNFWKNATTAVLGRVNAEGFLGFWPTMIGAEGVDPRDEAFAQWLVDVEKVVFSSTLTEPAWDRTTIENRAAGEAIAELKQTDGGDIVVLSSASIIKALLEADAVDTLSMMIFPVFLGGGPRLFEDGLPSAEWSLTSQATSENGAISLVYDRIR
ncbi:dihydrofolate reductase family protein [Glycomyces sp. NPDC046736]|uniref:dihydrofolate reductase family protein n=1 Tax=Glycomyces sp. NPDC046736 TaxID=3155615 RepID=UPI0033F75A43